MFPPWITRRLTPEAEKKKHNVNWSPEQQKSTYPHILAEKEFNHLEDMCKWFFSYLLHFLFSLIVVAARILIPICCADSACSRQKISGGRFFPHFRQWCFGAVYVVITAKEDRHHYAKVSHIAGQLILLAAVTSWNIIHSTSFLKVYKASTSDTKPLYLLFLSNFFCR